MNTMSELEREFLEAHRVLVSNLAALAAALRGGRYQEARRVAAQIDPRAGAHIRFEHIRFEEEVFYPRVVPFLGAEFVDKLCRKHRDGQEAIRLILDGSPFDAAWDEALSKVETMLGHARRFGTLISHISGLSEEVQTQLLDELRSFRLQLQRWSELDAKRRQQEPVREIGRHLAAPPAGTTDSELAFYWLL